MSFFNCKWPVHVASCDFFIDEVHNVVWLNFSRREVVWDESEVDRRWVAYRWAKGEIMNKVCL